MSIREKKWSPGVWYLVGCLLLSLVVSIGYSFAESDDTESLEEDEQLNQAVQEIIQIQQELGGSIVDLPTTSSIDPHEPSSAAHRQRLDDDEISERVEALRHVARDLDERSYELEGLDLYPQADAVRDVAHNLRMAARELRAQQLPKSEKAD